MEQNELLQDLALKLDLANMELQTIDEVLARRPALAGLKHRTEKIERACHVNSELLMALTRLLPNLKNWLADVQADAPDGWQGLADDIALAEAAIRKAKGE